MQWKTSEIPQMYHQLHEWFVYTFRVVFPACCQSQSLPSGADPLKGSLIRVIALTGFLPCPIVPGSDTLMSAASPVQTLLVPRPACDSCTLKTMSLPQWEIFPQEPEGDNSLDWNSAPDSAGQFSHKAISLESLLLPSRPVPMLFDFSTLSAAASFLAYLPYPLSFFTTLTSGQEADANRDRTPASGFDPAFPVSLCQENPDRLHKHHPLALENNDTGMRQVLYWDTNGNLSSMLCNEYASALFEPVQWQNLILGWRRSDLQFVEARFSQDDEYSHTQQAFGDLHDPLLYFLSTLSITGSVVARYTDGNATIYVYMDRHGQLHRVTLENLLRWLRVYSEQQLERFLSEIFSDNLPAGGGEAPENWSRKHRAVPFSTLRMLERLSREQGQQRPDLRCRNAKIRSTPVINGDPPDLKAARPDTISTNGHSQLSGDSGAAPVEPAKSPESYIDQTLPETDRTASSEALEKHTPSENSPIDGVPNEVLEHIFNFLDSPEELKKLRLVNRRLKTVIDRRFEKLAAVFYLRSLPSHCRQKPLNCTEKIFNDDHFRTQLAPWIDEHWSGTYEASFINQDRLCTPAYRRFFVSQVMKSSSLGIREAGVIRQQYLNPEHFSFDGHYFVSVHFTCNKMSPTIWSLAGYEYGYGQEETTLPHKNVWQAAFSPTDLELVTVSPKSVKIWSQEASGEWREVKSIEYSDKPTVVYSPDGESLGVEHPQYTNKPAAHILIKTARGSWEDSGIAEESDFSNKVVFSSDSTIAAIATLSQTCQILKKAKGDDGMITWKKVNSIQCSGVVLDPTISPDCQCLAAYVRDISPGINLISWLAGYNYGILILMEQLNRCTGYRSAQASQSAFYGVLTVAGCSLHLEISS